METLCSPNSLGTERGVLSTLRGKKHLDDPLKGDHKSVPQQFFEDCFSKCLRIHVIACFQTSGGHLFLPMWFFWPITIKGQMHQPSTPRELPQSTPINILCGDGWVGLVKRAEGSECCLAKCHLFQCKENKSICEVATGAECTFATGVWWVPTCSGEYALMVVCVCWSRLGDWLGDFTGICAVFGHFGCCAI